MKSQFRANIICVVVGVCSNTVPLSKLSFTNCYREEKIKIWDETCQSHFDIVFRMSLESNIEQVSTYSHMLIYRCLCCSKRSVIQQSFRPNIKDKKIAFFPKILEYLKGTIAATYGMQSSLPFIRILKRYVGN